jgi:hypothetical protein
MLEKGVAEREAFADEPIARPDRPIVGRLCRRRGMLDLTIMLGVSALAALIIYWVAGPVES